MNSLKEIEQDIGRQFTASELLYTKVIRISGTDTMRVVSGPFANLIEVDYSHPDLSEVKRQIKFALKTLEQAIPSAFRYATVSVFQGGSHLELVEEGTGPLYWLYVSDNYYDASFFVLERGNENEEAR